MQAPWLLAAAMLLVIVFLVAAVVLVASIRHFVRRFAPSRAADEDDSDNYFGSG